MRTLVPARPFKNDDAWVIASYRLHISRKKAIWKMTTTSRRYRAPELGPLWFRLPRKNLHFKMVSESEISAILATRLRKSGIRLKEDMPHR